MLFNSILNNKYLSQEIFGYCKCEDIEGYNYYDMTLDFICRLKRYDIFDHRWNLSFNSSGSNDKCGGGGDVNLLKITPNDIISFFETNDSLKRVDKVWNVFNQVLKSASLGEDHLFFILCSLVKIGAEKQIKEFVDDNIEIFLLHRYKTVEQIAIAIGSKGSIEFYNHSLKFFSKLIMSNSYHQFIKKVLLAAANEKHYDLGYHIINSIKKDEVKSYIFFVSELPTPILKYVFKNVPSSVIKYDMFPCFPIEDADLDILDIIQQQRLDFVQINIGIAYSHGNIKVLEFLYSNYQIQPDFNFNLQSMANLDALKFYLSHHPQKRYPLNGLEYSCLKSLELVKYLHTVLDFKFTSKAYNAPFNVLQYLVDNDCLEGIDFDAGDILFPFHYDLRVIKLLHQIHPTQFLVTFSHFQCFIFNGNNYHILEYILENSLVTLGIDDTGSLIRCSEKLREFRLILTHLKTKNPKFTSEFIRKIFKSKSIKITFALIECILAVYPKKCILLQLKKSVQPTLKSWFDQNSIFPNRYLRIPMIYKLLLKGYTEQEYLKDPVNNFSLTDVLNYAIDGSNYKLQRYVNQLINSSNNN